MAHDILKHWYYKIFNKSKQQSSLNLHMPLVHENNMKLFAGLIAFSNSWLLWQSFKLPLTIPRVRITWRYMLRWLVLLWKDQDTKFHKCNRYKVLWDLFSRMITNLLFLSILFLFLFLWLFCWLTNWTCINSYLNCFPITQTADCQIFYTINNVFIFICELWYCNLTIMCNFWYFFQSI